MLNACKLHPLVQKILLIILIFFHVFVGTKSDDIHFLKRISEITFQMSVSGRRQNLLFFSEFLNRNLVSQVVFLIYSIYCALVYFFNLKTLILNTSFWKKFDINFDTQSIWKYTLFQIP